MRKLVILLMLIFAFSCQGTEEVELNSVDSEMVWSKQFNRYVYILKSESSVNGKQRTDTQMYWHAEITKEGNGGATGDSTIEGCYYSDYDPVSDTYGEPYLNCCPGESYIYEYDADTEDTHLLPCF